MPGSQGAGDSEGTAILTSETNHVNNGSPPGAVTSPGGRMGGCGRCGKRCEGFLTDREQRKVWGIGILYVLGFPLLILMTIVGALKVTSSSRSGVTDIAYDMLVSKLHSMTLVDSSNRLNNDLALDFCPIHRTVTTNRTLY